MDEDGDRDARPWRPASSGASHVYVFVRPGEDLLKLGMSRDPLRRLQQLHPRWYEFFDLDTGWLAATDRVREARALERRLGVQLAEHRAPSPLTVSAGAGGDTEWFRGAAAFLEAESASLDALGYTVHQPLRPWLRAQLQAQSDRLFHWAEARMERIEAMPRPPGSTHPLEWPLCHALDALPALGLSLDGVSPRVQAWRADWRRRIGL